MLSCVNSASVIFGFATTKLRYCRNSYVYSRKNGEGSVGVSNRIPLQYPGANHSIYLEVLTQKQLTSDQNTY